MVNGHKENIMDPETQKYIDKFIDFCKNGYDWHNRRQSVATNQERYSWVLIVSEFMFSIFKYKDGYFFTFTQVMPWQNHTKHYDKLFEKQITEQTYNELVAAYFGDYTPEKYFAEEIQKLLDQYHLIHQQPKQKIIDLLTA